MSFFTDGPRERPLFPVREQELFGYEGRPWMGPPSDHIVPALLPWARPLGRSDRTIVALRGIEVWPSALTLRLAVYSRDSLQEGRSGSLIDHRRIPDYNALLLGALYPDGSRASSESISVPSASEPDAPVLRAVGVGGTQFHLDHQIFVWPLPGDGPFTLVIQWLDRDIKETHTELDGAAIQAAALEAGELWPGLPKRPGNGVALRRLSAGSAVVGGGSGFGPAAAPEVTPDPAAPVPVAVRSTGVAALPRRGSAAGASGAVGASSADVAQPSDALSSPGKASPLPQRNAGAEIPGAAQPANTPAEPPPPRPPGEAPPSSDRTTGADNPGVVQPANAPAEPLPQPSRLAAKPVLPLRDPGGASPLPRRGPATGVDSLAATQAEPLPQPSSPAAESALPPKSPSEASLPHRDTSGDSPTVAQPVHGPAEPLPRMSRPAAEPLPRRSPGEVSAFSRRAAAAGADGPALSQSVSVPGEPLPQPSRPAAEPAPPLREPAEESAAPRPDTGTGGPAASPGEPLPQPSRPAVEPAPSLSPHQDDGATVAQPVVAPEPLPQPSKVGFVPLPQPSRTRVVPRRDPGK